MVVLRTFSVPHVLTENMGCGDQAGEAASVSQV
jgi:hypothetical protein